MNLTACLAVSMFALLVVPGGVRADSPDQSAPQNPYASVDPDGVPLAVTQPGRPASPGMSADQYEALKSQEARQRNWLLLDYETALHMHNAHSDNLDDSHNVILQLSMNKELAQLAGLAPIDPSTFQPAPSLHAAPSLTSGNAPSLRPEAKSPNGAFTPLITPLSSPATMASQQYAMPLYSSAIPSVLDPNVDASSPRSTPSPAPTPSPKPVSPTETVDLQTPGMVGAGGDPLAEAPDLSLDSLPDNGLDVRSHDDPSAPPQLKQAMTVDQMRLTLDAKLKPKVAATVAAAQAANQQQKQPEAPKPIPVNPEDAPTPVSQQQQLSPVHPPIASPFDILNR